MLAAGRQAAVRAGEREDHLVRSLLGALAAFRWLAWAWMAVLLVVNRSDLRQDPARPLLGVALAAVALGATVAVSALFLVSPARLLSRPVVLAELATALVLEVGDGLVYNGVGHSQALASAWPLAGLLSAGIALGSRSGTVAGVLLGLGRLAGTIGEPTPWRDGDTVASASTIVLYALAGGLAGFLAARLRSAEHRISLAQAREEVAQAREEVARTLHDGVLQTLAIVQRRAGDPDLVGLARDQERELREYLFGTPSALGAGGDLGGRLRQAARLFEDRYGVTARVVVADDMPDLPQPVVEALAGAVGEALANAGKHAGATTVTVFAEPEGDEVFCSVKDDGTGFDPANAPEGQGLRRSVRGRLAEVGGRAQVDGRPGRGAEVRLRVPATGG